MSSPEEPLSNSLRIAVVDDDQSLARTLQSILVDLHGFRWAGSWRRPLRFLSELTSLEADVILLDIDMPKITGLDCITEIKQFHPHTSVIMLTVVDDDDTIFKALQKGADGYLLKDSSPTQLTQAIYDAAKGGAPMSAAIARRVIEHFKSPPNVESRATLSPNTGELAKLSPREREVIEALAKGLKYREIADQLFVSTETIKKHARQIYTKLEVRNRTEATTKYLKH